MNERVNENINSENYGLPKKKSKVGLIALIVIGLVVLGIGGFLYYRTISLKNPLKVLVHDTLNYMEGNISESKSGSGEFSLKVSGVSSDKGEDEIYSLIGKIGIEGHYGVDYTNKLIDFGIDTTYDNKNLVKVDTYFDDGNGYIYLDELYDKYIKVPIDDYYQLFEGNGDVDNYKTIIHSIDRVLLEALKDEYFVKEKIELDGKKVNKTTLKLDNKNYQSIKGDVLTALLDDNEFLESFAAVSGKNTSQVRESINQLKDERQEFEGVDISIYMNGSKWVQVEVLDSNDKIVVKNEETKYRIGYYEDNELLYEIVVESKIDDNKGTIVVSFDDKKEEYSITVNFDISYDTNKTVEKKDVSNSIDMDSISQEELQGIYSKILENEGIVTFAQEISKFGSNN